MKLLTFCLLIASCQSVKKNQPENHDIKPDSTLATQDSFLKLADDMKSAFSQYEQQRPLTPQNPDYALYDASASQLAEYLSKADSADLATKLQDPNLDDPTKDAIAPEMDEEYQTLIGVGATIAALGAIVSLLAIYEIQKGDKAQKIFDDTLAAFGTNEITAKINFHKTLKVPYVTFKGKDYVALQMLDAKKRRLGYQVIYGELINPKHPSIHTRVPLVIDQGVIRGWDGKTLYDNHLLDYTEYSAGLLNASRPDTLKIEKFMIPGRTKNPRWYAVATGAFGILSGAGMITYAIVNANEEKSQLDLAGKSESKSKDPILTLIAELRQIMIRRGKLLH